MEYLEDLDYRKEFNIFDKNAENKSIFAMVEQFIDQAFTKEELELINIQRQVNFEAN